WNPAALLAPCSILCPVPVLLLLCPLPAPVW
ncbi:hypothetical protein A2U01_0093664, partial [Trifolium medium]|nr:hypothetical protein [Trifolium medium]